MRSCENCQWCLTSEEEIEIMNEHNYEDTDLNRPLAGNCLIGIEPNSYYHCKEHSYIETSTKIYIQYDEKYLGPGYFIIMEYNNEPQVFIKIYKVYNKHFPEFRIYAYENDNFISEEQSDKDIELMIIKNSNQELYKIFKNLLQSLPFGITNLIYDNKNNSFNIIGNEEFIDIKISQKSIIQNNEINIALGDPYTYKYYLQMGTLYNGLSHITDEQSKKGKQNKILELRTSTR